MDNRGLSQDDQRLIDSIVERLRITPTGSGIEYREVGQGRRRTDKTRRRLFVRELWESGFTTGVIMRVLQVSRLTVARDLEAIEEEIRQGIDKDWAARKFAASIYSLERHARWAENKSEAAMLSEDQARFRSLAINAEKAKATLILRVVEADIAQKILGAGGGTDGEPRTIEDVFEQAARERIEESQRAIADAREFADAEIE
jgi:hypothetical protein